MADDVLPITRLALRVATLRWRPRATGDAAAQTWLSAALALPGAGGLTADPERGLWLARRGPGEAWLLADIRVEAAAAAWAAVRDAGAPGRGAVRTVDLSEAVTVLPLQGRPPGALHALLSRLADASALPAQAPAASPCLVHELPALLLSLAPDEAWLCVEAPLAPTFVDALQRAARFDAAHNV